MSTSSIRRLILYLLGDSLTEGYTRSGTVFHPYKIQLEKRLKNVYPNFEITQEGISGDRASGRFMVRRLTTYLNNKSSEGEIVDWVIIMGGTNDIFQVSSDKTFEGLKNLYDICEQHNSKVLALSILEFNKEWAGYEYDKRRVDVNELIRQNMFFYDIARDLPFDSNSYWEPDGVHLTAEGYDRMGDLIFEELHKKINHQD
ncbi:17346_t:CDS:2 [Acaulospora morrowiae]|uniref:17346_t:CDS:1 n=1 Tax=Acaulospora morrowiae TaxID=94023 RepID=A0A9N9H1E1_9GLOM|nr:17346_t:CDS:2 [Acaulospora morrowiae]